ncbi:hypothetical protein RR46_03784 [Papilio xuthus]|uniref:FLYWCH-type domain-containing protein n=1 Tax=Papilio xuthus TaxID=66420 RepID=A0A194Q338_PAPXU|nr:hypothetical protein RR46_03784 [Papilio xuthus]
MEVRKDWQAAGFVWIQGFVFRTSRSGNCVLCKGDYRYKKQYEYLDGRRIKWKCIKAGKTRGACKATAQLVFTTSRYGKPVLQCGKYRYNRNNRSYGPRALWVCCRVSSGCRASITTIDDVVVKEKSMHNH